MFANELDATVNALAKVHERIRKGGESEPTCVEEVALELLADVPKVYMREALVKITGGHPWLRSVQYIIES